MNFLGNSKYILVTSREEEAIVRAIDIYVREYDSIYDQPKFMKEDLRALRRILIKLEEPTKESLNESSLPIGSLGTRP